MTPNDLRHELRRLGLSQPALARMLAVNERTARRWASGDQPIPSAVEALLPRLDRAEAYALLRAAS